MKNCYRQYQQAVAIRTMLKNNLISSLDLTFPDANKLFSSPAKSNGCEKWVDFIGDFWHSECIFSLSEETFAKKYLKWCQKHGYIFTRSKSDEIYSCAVNSASLSEITHLKTPYPATGRSVESSISVSGCTPAGNASPFPAAS